MKILASIFKNLNIAFSDDHPISSESTTILNYINNPDGSIRWIWPSNLTKPLFLKFYSITSVKSFCIAFIIKVVFLLRLQKVVFKSINVYLSNNNETPLIDFTKSNWALFTGTLGPNRKAIVYQYSGTKSSFLKIGLNEKSKSLIQNEEKAIQHLEGLKVKSFIHPELIHSSDNYLEISDISHLTKRKASFTESHRSALEEMSEINSKFEPLSSTTFWKKLKQDLSRITSKNDNRIPVGILKKITTLVKSIDESTMIRTSWCHGDFTPWNMYLKNGKLHIYDWELYKEDMMIGYDAFHYFIQKGILIDRKSWVEIEKEISNKLDNQLANLSGQEKIDAKLYLKLYLLFNTVFNLNVFTDQKKWHIQVYWLLNTWNDAFSSILAEATDHRSLLIMDVFDFVLSKPYAALKFPDCPPEELDEYSDIDMCIDQRNAIELYAYLKKHSLVLRSNVVHKSYMMVLELICKDGSILCIDLIWILKRRSSVIMEVVPLIERARLNGFQVKIPKEKDLAEFVSLFYLSNKVAVPTKFTKLTSKLKNSNNPFRQKLYQLSSSSNPTGQDLDKIINEKDANKGWQKMENSLSYFIDSIKEMKSRSGMIVTFSGVDGAGKSTIIDKVKHHLEKKMRRRVIVIRHRPSILPILSAWTKGQKVAEEEAANQLPRQGGNSSSFSSFLRFMYYYTDYFFGQFVIYFKYKVRGYVVLYDRYYYDFINDSKRSNIELPSFLTRLGYYLLLSPNLNFFLYADSALILSRKKELDANTIDNLTYKYKRLFEELDKGELSEKYIAIENIDLNATLSAIIDRIAGKNGYAK